MNFLAFVNKLIWHNVNPNASTLLISLTDRYPLQHQLLLQNSLNFLNTLQ